MVQGMAKKKDNYLKKQDIDNSGESYVEGVHEYEHQKLTKTQKKVVGILGMLIFIVLSVAIVYFVGKPMMKYMSEPEKFRDWVQEYGMWGWLICIGMMVLQIVIAIIPGGALEMGAGYAFGVIEGSILCIIGSIIGCVLVFQFVRIFGVKLVEAFFSLEKIRSLKFLHDERKRNILAFIIFLIPGTPKDLLSYFMGLTDMKLGTWVVISTIARIPAIVLTVMGGNALGSKRYVFAIVVTIIVLIVSAVGMIVYKKICQYHSKKVSIKKNQTTLGQKPNTDIVGGDDL